MNPFLLKEVAVIEDGLSSLLAGYNPISSSFLCAVAYSVQSHKIYERLVDEIRDAFEDITADALVSLTSDHRRTLHSSRSESTLICSYGHLH